MSILWIHKMKYQGQISDPQLADWARETHLNSLKFVMQQLSVELVSKELNHLAAILYVYAGGLNFMK